MKEEHKNVLRQAYKESQQTNFLFSKYLSSSLPINYQDSLSPVPNHPFCAIGVLLAEADWGSKKGVAFVIHDSYLFTCASNCYSSEDGEYPNITFTISSSRKLEQDTYKISKVFIPQQYKTLAENERNQYNYALLFIQGEPKMQAQYGSIGLDLKEHNDDQYLKILTTLECTIASNKLVLVSEPETNQSLSNILSGTPLLCSFGNYFVKLAIGFIRKGAMSQHPTILLFSHKIKIQINQWVHSNKSQFALTDNYFYYDPILPEQFEASCLEDEVPTPIQTVSMDRCNIYHRTSFFEQLPFSSINNLSFNDSQLGDSLTFLQLRKFRCLKQLSLKQNLIGPLGCKLIASLAFQDLIFLELSLNPLGNQGARCFSKARWPKLKYIRLDNCEIGSEGMLFLSQQKWRNLSYMQLEDNQFDSELSSILEIANTSRLIYLSLSGTDIYGHYLNFLRSPPWKSLSQLYLSECHLKTKGCKMIKQAGLMLTILKLSYCDFDWIGMKWLCKANLTKMQHILIYMNEIGDEGCYFLSRANIPNLYQFQFSDQIADYQGLKRLLESDWAIRVSYRNSYLSQLAEEFNRIRPHS